MSAAVTVLVDLIVLLANIVSFIFNVYLIQRKSPHASWGWTLGAVAGALFFAMCLGTDLRSMPS